MKKIKLTIYTLFISGMALAQYGEVWYGLNALQINTGNYNSAFGYYTLNSNTSGYANSALGFMAMRYNQTGYGNTAMGHAALEQNNNGHYNVAIGYASLLYKSAGNDNVAVGGDAGRFTNAGGSNTIANKSIFIGYGTRSKATNSTNEIIIGASARGEGSNTVVLGNDVIVATLLKGNVCIGLTPAENTENYTLAVNGTLGVAEGIKVETGLTVWPDFVFEKAYALPSLSEVENYIAKNGHLKDVPSAEEVGEDGIDLGEMDANLLQKIEELTLYTIAQEKELAELRAMIENIKVKQ